MKLTELITDHNRRFQLAAIVMSVMSIPTMVMFIMWLFR